MAIQTSQVPGLDGGHLFDTVDMNPSAGSESWSEPWRLWMWELRYRVLVVGSPWGL